MKILESYLTKLNEEKKLSPYQMFVKTKLKKWGIKTPMQLKTDAQKSKFWDEVKRDWNKQKK